MNGSVLLKTNVILIKGSEMDKDVIRALKDARDLAMNSFAVARIPESADFGAIAQNLDWALGQILATQPTTTRSGETAQAAPASQVTEVDFLEEWLKILIAPKMYLIEYAAQLVKGH
jgi:hypothetical protein